MYEDILEIMRKKIIFLLFVLCLIKLYDIAGRSLNFSPNLLINSFKEDGGEKSSLVFTGDDVIPIRNFFLSNNIMEFKLSEKIKKNHEIYYLRMMEFNYPIKEVKNTPIFVTHKKEIVETNCELLLFTQNFNIYECK